jgi:carotenoid cleavage dioxygenase-like enzyme
MSNLFPDKAVYAGLNRPVRIEAVVSDLEFSGDIPAALHGGTYYRNGPDPRFPALHGDDINVNGDGLVTMWRFGHNHVDFACRFVRTERYELERAAHRALFGVYRNPFTADPGVRDRDGTTANTTALFHAGRLLALKEDGRPYVLDPDTLATIGKHDFGGRLQSETFTAHPKIDPATGELLSHGYEARGLATRDISVQVVSREGELVREEFLQAPYVSFMHDWAVTAEHFIFPVTPTTADLARMQRGGAHWMFQPDLPGWFGILRRDADASSLRWFRVPNSSAGHIVNAFNDGDIVYVDMLVSERSQFPFIENADGLPFDRERAVPRFTRHRFDLCRPGEECSAQTLFPDFMELPVVDARYACHPYRHAFVAILDRSRRLGATGTIGFGWNTLGHVDLATGRLKTYYVGDGNTAGEPCFVPRSPGAPEGDGYVLAVLSCHGAEVPHSRLIILDTQDITTGPVAWVALPFRLHSAVHGNWVSGADRKALT